MFFSRKLLIILITAVTLITMAIGCDGEESEQEESEQEESEQEESDELYEGTQTITWDGLERTFRVHVPPSYSAAQEWPLVVVMHGGGSRAVTIELSTGFSNLADEEGFIAVYPNGTGTLEPLYLGFNAGHCCGITVDNEVDDVGFLREMINEIKSNLSIDSSRIYATGFSNGAMMSHHFAAECSDIVAAIAPVEGTIGGRESINSDLVIPPQPSDPVSVLIIHGTADPAVPFEGGHDPNTAGTRIDLSVAESAAFWVEANGCDGDSPEITEDDGVQHTIYSGGREGSVVEIIAIEGGEHHWPGKSADEIKKVDATQVIWEFFKAH